MSSCLSWTARTTTVVDLAVAPTGATVATASDDGSVHLWPLTGRESVFAGALHRANSFQSWSHPDLDHSVKATLAAIDGQDVWLQPNVGEIVAMQFSGFNAAERQKITGVQLRFANYLRSKDQWDDTAASLSISAALPDIPNEIVARVRELQDEMHRTMQSPLLSEPVSRDDFVEGLKAYTGSAGHVDWDKAHAAFAQAAEQDDPVAQLWVRILQSRGHCLFRLDKAAATAAPTRHLASAVRKLADQGDVQALFVSGCASLYGVGTEQGRYCRGHGPAQGGRSRSSRRAAWLGPMPFGRKWTTSRTGKLAAAAWVVASTNGHALAGLLPAVLRCSSVISRSLSASHGPRNEATRRLSMNLGTATIQDNSPSRRISSWRFIGINWLLTRVMPEH